jgi:hypothetical protein
LIAGYQDNDNINQSKGENNNNNKYDKMHPDDIAGLAQESTENMFINKDKIQK